MEENQLNSKVFEDTGSSGFEIAFTALVCTYVLQLPLSEAITENILTGSVLILIMIALVRMMAVQSDYRPYKGIIRVTQVLIEAITLISILYGLRTIFDIGGVPIIGIYVSVILFPVILIILHEWIFGDLLIYYAAVAYVFYSSFNSLSGSTNRESPLEKVGLQFSENLLKQILVFSRAEIPDRLSELSSYKKTMNGYETGEETNQILISLLLLIVLLFAPFVVIYFIAETTVIQTVIALWLVLSLWMLIRFWYRAYGLYENTKESFSTILLQITVYALAAVLIFQWA